MKNKGLHTTRRIIPLGGHKDQPTPQPATPSATQQDDAPSVAQQSPKPAQHTATEKPRFRTSVRTKQKDDTSPRFVLRLMIDEALLERFENTITPLPDAAQRQYRRRLSAAFVSYISENGMKSRPYAPKKPVGHRIDVRLPKHIVAKSAALERVYPLETDNQVLSRYLSGHYAAFIESILDKP